MKVKVTEKMVSITEITEVYEGEFGVNRCDFTLPKSFDGLCVTAVFNGIPVPLTEGKCIIPSLPNGNCILGVYAYRKNGEETELMYSPKPTMFFVGKGSFCREMNEEIIPEVFDYETYCQMLQGYWRELFGENTFNEYKEDATEHQYYSAKAVNKICSSSAKVLPDNSLDGEMIFAENEVYNANSVNAAMFQMVEYVDNAINSLIANINNGNVSFLSDDIEVSEND